MILPALLLSLEEYSSWRVRRVVPMICSAVRITLRSLLWSDLVAELNQRVIDVQRTDSMNYCLNSAWHEGDQFVALLRWYDIFFGLLFLIFLLTIAHRFSMGFRSGEYAGQSSTPTPWSFNQLLAVSAGAKSC